MRNSDFWHFYKRRKAADLRALSLKYIFNYNVIRVGKPNRVDAVNPLVSVGDCNLVLGGIARRLEGNGLLTSFLKTKIIMLRGN